MAGNSSIVPDLSDDDENYQIRIQPSMFLAWIASFLGIAILSTAVRMILRWRRERTLYIEDYLVVYSVLAAGACAAVAWSIKDQMYLQIYVGLKQVAPPDGFLDSMLVFEQRIQACSSIIWSIIYAIKLSFLYFFRRLVSRVRHLKIQWWWILSITGACAAISIPLGFIICPNFSPDYLTYCPVTSQLLNEKIYLYLSASLDVITDLLVMSIPVVLLWKVRLPLWRKLYLTCILCLSVLCAVVCIVRVVLAPLPNGVIDTSWLAFWQGLEAAVAIIVVNLSTFRGLFADSRGRIRRRSGQPQVYRGNSDHLRPILRNHGSSQNSRGLVDRVGYFNDSVMNRRPGSNNWFQWTTTTSQTHYDEEEQGSPINHTPEVSMQPRLEESAPEVYFPARAMSRDRDEYRSNSAVGYSVNVYADREAK